MALSPQQTLLIPFGLPLTAFAASCLLIKTFIKLPCISYCSTGCFRTIFSFSSALAFFVILLILSISAYFQIYPPEVLALPLHTLVIADTDFIPQESAASLIVQKVLTYSPSKVY